MSAISLADIAYHGNPKLAKQPVGHACWGVGGVGVPPLSVGSGLPTGQQAAEPWSFGNSRIGWVPAATKVEADAAYHEKPAVTLKRLARLERV